MSVIAVIVGSTREGRFSERPAAWIFERLRMRGNIEPRLLDLRDYPMPFFDQPKTPAMPGRAPFPNDIVQKWTKQIAEADAYVFATPEYNFGPPAVLKNAIDWVYPEWRGKPAAFVSWGAASGSRAVQQLREIAVELEVVPIRSSVLIPVATLWAHFQGGDVAAGLAQLDQAADKMIDDLLWWSALLAEGRARKAA